MHIVSGHDEEIGGANGAQETIYGIRRVLFCGLCGATGVEGDQPSNTRDIFKKQYSWTIPLMKQYSW